MILVSNRHGVQIANKTLIEGTFDACEFLEQQDGLISVSSVKITHNCKIEVKTVKVDFRSKAGVKTHQDKVMWYYGEQNIKANLNQA